ncbi:GPI mannosyltransferase 1 [Phlyctochytrium planicorne]|nr:GPI mannosyltransferase 1 [Phlyctochytrium planicorne]
MVTTRAASKRAVAETSTGQEAIPSTSQSSTLTAFLIHPIYAPLALRLILLIISHFQDSHLPVKYTDIDYHVFTDASQYVIAGDSPYLRATYRYTPLLAWLLTPQAFLGKGFGKAVFVASDIGVGLLLGSWMERRGVKGGWAWTAGLWGLNPFVAVISTRGNAESLINFMSLLAIYLLERRKVAWAAVVFGVSVHFKIYPVIYAVAIWRYLREGEGMGWRGKGWFKGSIDAVIRFWSLERIEFGVLSAGVFFCLGAWMYLIYGQPFLEHTYLYHATRQDHRHNFSLYFYYLYLNQSVENPDPYAGLLPFVPQLAMAAWLGWRLGKEDLGWAVFAQTFAFVMGNKVVTSQAVWLFFAYKLEHLGQNTFRELWMAGVGFAMCNAIVLAVLLWERGGNRSPRKTDGKPKKKID